MGRILAIDYGRKRCGIAVTDPLRLIATGLTTIHSKDMMKFLQAYFSKEVVDLVVVGEPKTLQNKASESASYIEPFVKLLARTYPGLRIERFDERFTSRIALQSMLEGGMKKKDRQNKETVDKISAVIILQDYMRAHSI